MDNPIRNILALFLIAIVTLLLGFSFKIAILEESKSENTLRLLTVQRGKNQWSYEIYQGSTLLIRQRHIPAIKGTQYFSSKKDAEVIGGLVVQKLMKNLPPTLSIEELAKHDIVLAQE